MSGLAPQPGVQGKTIVVTGAASGIGAATARLLEASGARVIAVDRNAPSATYAGYVQADLGDPGSIGRAVAALPARIDGLANIAGVPGTAPAAVVARVNYLGLRTLTEALAPRMTRNAGIVNLASGVGLPWIARAAAHVALARTASFDAGLAWLDAHPVDPTQSYRYFKEALIVWTFERALALKQAFGVRMNAVSPGPIATPIIGDFRKDFGDATVDATIAAGGRIGEADDVAPVAAFLLADAAQWVVGANLSVDGGVGAKRALAAAGAT